MNETYIGRAMPAQWIKIPHYSYGENFTSNTFLLKYKTHQELLHTYKLEVLKKIFPNEDKLREYLQDSITFFEYISLLLPIPKLIYQDSAVLHFEEGIAYYRTKFPHGDIKTLADLTTKNREEIALILRKIHQIDVTPYIAPIFSYKSKLLVHAWELLVSVDGLKQLKQLAWKQFRFNLEPLVQLLEQHFSLDDMSNYGKNLVFAHADIKPKNVMWLNNEISALLHWDEMCYTTAESDFIETLINWTIDKTQDSYHLNHQRAVEFREAYKLPLTIQPLDLAIVIARWCFYTLFCYQNEHEAGYNEGMRMFAFFDREQNFLLHLT